MCIWAYGFRKYNFCTCKGCTPQNPSKKKTKNFYQCEESIVEAAFNLFSRVWWADSLNRGQYNNVSSASRTFSFGLVYSILFHNRIALLCTDDVLRPNNQLYYLYVRQKRSILAHFKPSTLRTDCVNGWKSKRKAIYLGIKCSTFWIAAITHKSRNQLRKCYFTLSLSLVRSVALFVSSLLAPIF